MSVEAQRAEARGGLVEPPLLGAARGADRGDALGVASCRRGSAAISSGFTAARAAEPASASSAVAGRPWGHLLGPRGYRSARGGAMQTARPLRGAAGAVRGDRPRSRPGAARASVSLAGAALLLLPRPRRVGAVGARRAALRPGRRGACARWSSARSGLVLLHLNGEPYTQKPPLYYWLAALAGRARRARDARSRRACRPRSRARAASRSRSRSARACSAARAGLLGAALLLTTFEFAHLARRVQLDVLLALFETPRSRASGALDRGIGRALARSSRAAPLRSASRC